MVGDSSDKSDNSSGVTGTQNTNESPAVSIVYLHSQLISPKLDDMNYMLWKQQVLTTIEDFGLEKFLISEPKSAPAAFILGSSKDDIIVNPAYDTWRRQEKSITSWLLAYMTESVLIGVVGLAHTSDIWDTLESNFSSQSRARLMQLKFQLQTLKKESSSMNDYLNKVKTCCDILCSAGERVSDDNQILHILTGLGQQYNDIMVSLTYRVEPCTLREVKALLLSYESRLEMVEHLAISTEGSSPTTNMAYQTQQNRNPNYHNQNRGRSNGNFRRGGGRNHTYRGRGGRYNPNYKPRCQICKILGHTADRCHERGNPNFVPKNSMSFPQEMNWYPNSGASNHVTHDFGNLNITGEYRGNENLQVGNGTSLEILHVGDSVLKSNSPHSHAFLLKSLLHVPKITKNLISVSQFARDNNVFFEFYPTFYLVKDQVTRATLLTGKLDCGLYCFNLTNSPPSSSASIQPSHHSQPAAFASSLENKDSLSLWHYGLGHASLDIVKKGLLASRIPFIVDSTIQPCVSCVISAPPHNTHSMTTRAKAGIHKPKALPVCLLATDSEPASYKQALQLPIWHQAMRLFLSQRQYILNILKKTNMLSDNGISSPMVTTPALSKFDGLPLMGRTS
ncbi:hypothetical protein C2S53_004692 [Perilla frutescens var. hirtella]|uniref:GAG-pre-integrase domain-containing protein n=1 Tax=Perilla frutescens var. hirtella TaxID=608512 RepID=A0AAD4J4K9_PERFH|nr:hypothetical protein C2S53_004692 [Perilla frutescens var. hirtella]